MESSASYQRYIGFRQAIENYNLNYCEERQLYIGDLKLETGRKLAEMCLKREGGRPTGVVIGNDLMALGFIDYCMKNNIRIPEELSVVSFDNITFSDLCGISLTTIDHHVEDLCRRAVDMMLYHIDHQNDDKVFHEMLEPTLIVRKTTAPPCCG